MRIIGSVFFALAMCMTAAQAQTLPTTSPSPDYPKGVVTKYSFDQSKIFPGTTRSYWIYVPKQYDGSKPACLFLDQDGVQFKTPAVFDQLIATGEMPVTIGIFVQSGTVKAQSKDALDRSNRSFEYDALGDRYSRFLLEELLPHIVAEQKLNLSTDPNDRCIAGSSSGAICAFTVAWEHPEAFSRVFSSIGTFVSLRGGNEYPFLIRKTEPKALRVFLEDGSGDHNHQDGDWWMANQTMERALIYAGYEVNHFWGVGGHNAKEATEIFPDAMRWIWKDWPTRVKASKGATKNQEFLIEDQPWQIAGQGYQSVDGPCVNPAGEVFFCDIAAGKTYKIATDGKVSELPATLKVGRSAFGPDGRRYVAATAAGQMIAYDPDGKSTVIAEGIHAKDLIVAHNGAIYATEPAANSAETSKVWYISPAGEKRVVDEGLKCASGIALSDDQSLLSVSDSQTKWVYSFVIQPDGSLADKENFYHLHIPDSADDSGADGMHIESHGYLFISTRLGVEVGDDAGVVEAIFPVPGGKISGLCFGGEQFDTLYATCGDKVFKRKVKSHGANAFAAPFKWPSEP